jgi:hypothetical protein
MKKIEINTYDELDLIRVLNYAKKKRKEDFQNEKSTETESNMYINIIDRLLEVINIGRSSDLKTTSVFKGEENL